MMKQLTAVAAAATLLTGAAHATPISFSSYATGNEGGVDQSAINFGGTSISIIAGGVPFQAGAGFGIAIPGYFGYLDGPSGGLPGGLGVCRALNGPAGSGATGAHCTDSSDDSIDGDGGFDEGLLMLFGGSYNLLGLSFRDGAHNPINNSLGLVSFVVSAASGNNSGVTTFADLVMRATAGEFVGTTIFGLGYVDTEFYLEGISDVPLPAALPLMLAGLGGLRLASRKKRKAAQA